MDAFTAKLRAALERDPQTTVVSLDGRSAYDCISRAAFLHKLHEVAPALVPFARLFYGQASEYLWWDESGERHSIFQGEGCEQGDPLAPALFALGQHAGLQHAAERLQDGCRRRLGTEVVERPVRRMPAGGRLNGAAVLALGDPDGPSRLPLR